VVGFKELNELLHNEYCCVLYMCTYIMQMYKNYSHLRNLEYIVVEYLRIPLPKKCLLKQITTFLFLHPKWKENKKRNEC